jgi:hypothetical protein
METIGKVNDGAKFGGVFWLKKRKLLFLKKAIIILSF